MKTECDCGYGTAGVYIHAPDCPAMLLPADPRTNNPGTGFTGVRVDKTVTDEAEHFYVCASCGEAVDCRDLGQVFHHEDDGHSPLGAS